MSLYVRCSDGVRQSGLYVAISCIWERLKDNQEVDIFQAVRELRYHRPQIIHDVVSHYHSLFNSCPVYWQLYTVAKKTHRLCFQYNAIASKSTWKLQHRNSILECFEYFCQMSSKSMLIILSYTISKLVYCFWDNIVSDTSCSWYTGLTHGWVLWGLRLYFVGHHGLWELCLMMPLLSSCKLS